MKSVWRKVGIIAYWLSWPLLKIYLGWRRPSTRVIILSQDDVLLVQGWLGSGEWIFPGGGLHKDESEEQGAVREVFEETGITLQPSQLQKISEGIAYEHGLRYHYIAFVVRLDIQPPVHSQKWELTAIMWQSLQDLQNLSPHTKSLLHDLE